MWELYLFKGVLCFASVLFSGYMLFSAWKMYLKQKKPIFIAAVLVATSAYLIIVAATRWT